jgi:hypothetical protein
VRLKIQRWLRLSANASTGGNAASSIGMRGLVGAVRRKFELVMAAPADEREHAFTLLKLKL